MKHFIQGDTYILVDDNDNIILSINLVPEMPNNQIILRVKDEVYAGPVDFIHFKEE